LRTCARARSIASSLSASVSSKVPSRSNTTALNGGPTTPPWQGGMVQGPCSTSTCIALGRRLTSSTGHEKYGGALLFSTDHVAVLIRSQYCDVSLHHVDGILPGLRLQFVRSCTKHEGARKQSILHPARRDGHALPAVQPPSRRPRANRHPPSRVAAAACAARPRTPPRQASPRSPCCPEMNAHGQERCSCSSALALPPRSFSLSPTTQ